MKRFWKAMVLFSLTIVLLAACSNSKSSHSGKAKSSDSVASHENAVDQSSVEQNGDKKEVTKNINLHSRMVVYTANLDMEVKNISKVQDQIRDIVTQMSGYIVEQRMNQDTDERKEGSLTVRVPQEHFQSFLSKVKSFGLRIENQSITGQDVTEEYVDLQSRLKSKKLAERRLTQFMNEAKDTKTLLEISNELSKVQEEIETLEGQIKYIENQTNLSTVRINIFENKVIVPELEKNHLNTWEKTKKQFMKSINFLVSFLSGLFIFIIGNLPILVLLGLIALTVFIIWKRHSKKSNNTIEK